MNGTTITYTYDASGNRLTKKVADTTEVYVRDASGNVMGIYKQKGSTAALVKTETDIYGSSRIGSINTQIIIPDTFTLAGGYGKAVVYTLTREETDYQVIDHRGNVMLTVADRKLQVTTDNSTIAYYVADVATAQDYSSFGSLLEGRQYGSTTRRTYNDKELDKETGWQDYGMRPYLVDVPIFGKVDPLTGKYPMLTPYQFASDNPILNIDLDGLEGASTMTPTAASNTFVNPGGSMSAGVMPARPTFTPSTGIPSTIGGATPAVNTSLPAQTQFITSEEFQALIPPKHGFSLDHDGKGGLVYGPNGSWHISLLKVSKKMQEAADHLLGTKGNLLNPYEDKTADKSDDSKYITLYRGVGTDIKPAMLYYFANNAKLAIPKGLLPDYCKTCHAEPDDHTMNDNVSIFTSWTSDKQTAIGFARGPMGDSKGVVLTIRVARAETIRSELGKTLFSSEDEYLLIGVRKADSVENVTPTIRH